MNDSGPPKAEPIKPAQSWFRERAIFGLILAGAFVLLMAWFAFLGWMAAKATALLLS